jgi:hypothetical protein
LKICEFHFDLLLELLMNDWSMDDEQDRKVPLPAMILALFIASLLALAAQQTALSSIYEGGKIDLLALLPLR